MDFLEKEQEKGRPSKSDVLFFKSLVHISFASARIVAVGDSSAKVWPSATPFPTIMHSFLVS